jgi:hypothetical protein
LPSTNSIWSIGLTGEAPFAVSFHVRHLWHLPWREVHAYSFRQWDVFTMAPGMATVDRVQGLEEVQLVDVCVHLGAKPFAKALHRFIALDVHLLLAKRATLVKEPGEQIH